MLDYTPKQNMFPGLLSCLIKCCNARFCSVGLHLQLVSRCHTVTHCWSLYQGQLINVRVNTRTQDQQPCRVTSIVSSEDSVMPSHGQIHLLWSSPSLLADTGRKRVILQLKLPLVHRRKDDSELTLLVVAVVLATMLTDASLPANFRLFCRTTIAQ